MGTTLTGRADIFTAKQIQVVNDDERAITFSARSRTVRKVPATIIFWHFGGRSCSPILYWPRANGADGTETER